MWLFVGCSENEVKESGFVGNYATLGFDGANKGDVFRVSTWQKLLCKYGEKSFDAIMTDGGLMNVKRVDEIIRIKHKLLKNKGFIYNYYSVIGDRVYDPLHRGYRYIFYKIPKKEYTILNHDLTYKDMEPTTWSGKLRVKLKLII